MKPYIYVFIAIPLLIFSRLNSQVISKFEFDNYSPIWSHYSNAESLSSNIQALSTTPYPIITNNHLYVTSNIFDKTTLNGHLSEKIDIKSGQSIWSNFQYSTAPNTREYAQSPYLENENYKINIFKEIHTPPSGPLSIFWSKSVLMRRSYNDVSGLELDSLVTDSLDKSNTLLNIPESIISNLKTILVKDGNNTRYSRVVPSGINYLFTSKLLNEFGHKIDSLGLEIPRSPFAPEGIRTYPLNDGNNLFLISSQNSIDSQSVQMLLLDKELNIIQNREMIDLLPIDYYHDLYFVVGKHLYMISNRNRDANNLYDIVVSKFNLEMKLLETLKFTKIPISIGLVDLPNGATLVSYAKEENGFSNLYFHKSNGQGDVTLVMKLKCNKPKDQLFVRSQYLTKDNNLLMNIIHVDENSSITPVPKWNNWSLFEGIDLGIPSSTKENKEFSSFQINPNPTTSLIEIKTDIDYDEVVISNINGVVQRISQRTNDNISVSDLPNGIYICEVKIRNKSLGKQKFVKIE